MLNIISEDQINGFDLMLAMLFKKDIDKVFNITDKERREQIIQKEKDYGKVRMNLEEYEILLKSIVRNNPTAICCKDYQSSSRC